MRALIKAGAAGVHFEDQLASAKKCGHMGGKVLVPTSEFVQKLQAARLAADVCDTPTVIIARTDALGAYLLTSDIDPRDKAFCTGGWDGFPNQSLWSTLFAVSAGLLRVSHAVSSAQLVSVDGQGIGLSLCLLLDA
jgi:isocitrate lyase